MTDKYITLSERFDRDKLQYLLSLGQDQLKPKIRDTERHRRWQWYKVLGEYLAKSRDGKSPVKYKQTNGRGRYMAMGSCSLQMMMSEYWLRCWTKKPRRTVAQSWKERLMRLQRVTWLHSSQHLCA